MLVLEVRHSCDQADNLDSYTWTEYDPRQGGVQVIKDSLNNVKITTEFLKVAGGDHGGSWAVRFKGEPIDEGTNLSFLLSVIVLNASGQERCHTYQPSFTLAWKVLEVSI